MGYAFWEEKQPRLIPIFLLGSWLVASMYWLQKAVL